MTLTPEQIKERNDRRKGYFGPERNERRRQRYETDPTYRDRELGRARVRKERALKPEEDPRRFLATLGSEAVPCQVYAAAPDGSDPYPHCQESDLPMELAFRTADLARLLNRSVNLLHRWRNDRKLPAATHWGLIRSENATSSFLVHVQVYLPEEVRAILEVYGQHLEQTPYYHSSHTDTRDKMFAAVQAVRSKAKHVRKPPCPTPEPANT